MKAFRTLATFCVVAAALSSAMVAAQGRQGGAGSQAAQGSAERARSASQERDVDRTQAAARDRDRDVAQDRDRDRDTTKLRDRDRVRDADIYGTELMTAQERDQYRQRLQSANSDQEWARLRAAHEEQMHTRAAQRGVNLPAPVYGQYMLTAQETERYRRRLENARDEQARAQVRAEHEEMVRTRAQELGLEAPPRS
jgi:hypothetical protein